MMSSSEKQTWSVAEGRQNFSRLVKSAAQAPQIITSRDQPIATVIDYESYQRFMDWQQASADRFGVLAQLCAEENYSLDVPGRSDRPDPFGL